MHSKEISDSLSNYNYKEYVLHDQSDCKGIFKLVHAPRSVRLHDQSDCNSTPVDSA